MKREGRQHGSVRTYLISPTSPINPAKKISMPTAGVFTPVPAKPTNHSKSTGKSKGARTKPRSTSGLDLQWPYESYDRSMLDTPSASDVSFRLRDDALEDGLDQYCYNRAVNQVNLDLDSLIDYLFISSTAQQISSEIVEEDDDEGELKGKGFLVEEDGGGGFRGERFDEILVVQDEDIGFYDVAIVWDPVEGDEGWSLIGQI